MIALIRFVLAVLASHFKSKSRLEADNAALRQQLIVLGCKAGRRARLTNGDRRFFVRLHRWFPLILASSANSSSVLKPWRTKMRADLRRRLEALEAAAPADPENIESQIDRDRQELQQILDKARETLEMRKREERELWAQKEARDG